MKRQAPERDHPEVPNTKQVYQTRVALEGMVIGPIDKNPGELSVVCPRLYHTTLKKLYHDKEGYERIYPAKYSRHKKQKYDSYELTGKIISKEPHDELAERNKRKRETIDKRWGGKNIKCKSAS